MTRTFRPPFLCVKKLQTVQACIRPDISAAWQDDTQCSTNYGISFQNTDMGRSLQPSGWCDSCPDVLIQKESHEFKIQTSGRQPSWSGRASYLYGNCVHLINRPDDHSFGSEARSLDMLIACSWSVTVRMIRQHRYPSGRGTNQERISVKFWKADRTVVRSDTLCLPSGRRLGLSSQMLIWTSSL
jgi:hypothetical protein